MNEETLKEMPEYVRKLPKEIQDFVFDGVWEERVEEIGLKYSLDSVQLDNLANKVLFILIGLEKPEDFLQTIISELSISRLLAEQIMNDLDSRVFDYAIKTIGIGQGVDEEKPQGELVEDDSLSKEVSDILKEETKIEPEKDMGGLDRLRSMSGDLKNIEEDKTRKEKEENSIPTNLPGAMVLEDKNPPKTSPESTAKEIPSAKSTKDFVQRPISVPRYTADLSDEDKGEYLLKKSGIYPEHMDEQNRSTNLKPDLSYKKESPSDFPEKPKTEDDAPEKPAHSYTVDPYREPLN
ncbi:MAG: hypothetical protein WC095_00890 [Candidatus Paceibacterota bacterium]